MSHTVLQEAEEMAEIIMGFQRCFVANLSRHLGHGEVSPAQFTLLGHLSHGQTMSMSNLAQHMNHTMPATTGLVDRLVEAGMAQRFPDPADRRRVMVGITEAGTELVETVKRDMAEGILQIFEMLGTEDKDAWVRIYRRIHTHFKSPACIEAREAKLSLNGQATDHH